MRIEEIIKMMFRSFFIIATGVTASMYMFCYILKPEVSFSLDDIGRILLMAFACDLPFVIYYSRKELGKKQMFIRKIIHFSVLLAVLLYLAQLWGWVSMQRPNEIATFVLLVICVYVIVFAITSYQDKKLAKKINESLKERYHS